MDTNTVAIIIEAIALVASIAIGVYSVKKTKKDINGEDLLNIFIGNKDTLIKIVNDISNIKMKDKTSNDIKRSISNKIDELLLNENCDILNDFQKKLIKTNKDFFIEILFDEIIDRIYIK